MFDVRRGFLAVDPELLASVLRASESKVTVRMSAIGPAWHQEEKGTGLEFLRLAVDLTEENSIPVVVRWWSNVFREGAEYPTHKHDGDWGFVYHLTEGAAVRFGKHEAHASFPATPGQILVFDSSLPHWTDKVVGDAPRVSVAGNLYFKR